MASPSSIFFDEEYFKRFQNICNKSGFMKKYVTDKEVSKDLLSNDYFLENQSMLRQLIKDYLDYVMLHIKPLSGAPSNEYYQKVKVMLDAQDDLKQSLIRRGVTDDVNQVCCILALGMIYYFLHEDWMDLIMRRKKIPT